MTGETVPLREHLDALQIERELRYEQRFTAQQRETVAAFAAAQLAREVKDKGDDQALNLARQIQDYKDEKANELREQINRERVLYATKDDLKAAIEKIEIAMQPIQQQLTLQQGRSSGLDKGWAILIGLVGLVATGFGIVAFFVA